MTHIYLTHYDRRETNEFHPDNTVRSNKEAPQGALFQFMDSDFIDPYRKRKPSKKVTRRIPKVDYLEAVRYNDIEVPCMRNLKGMIEDLEGIDVVDYYDVFRIPKSSGGYRTIKAPTGLLKTIQSSLKDILEEELRILPHQNAYAYTKNRSVYDAVAVHQENESKWFLKVDLENFFDNTTPEVVFSALGKIHPIAGMDEEQRSELFELLSMAAFLDNGLPQGTPLSPTLSNLVMVEFDVFMTKFAYDNALRYTRYADDIILSSKYKNDPTWLITNLKETIERCELPYSINDSKTRYTTHLGSNWNLGLMLNSDNKITIGHRRKKRIKNALFSFHINPEGWENSDIDQLMGDLEWLRSNEPEYYDGLLNWFNAKHRTSILDRILEQRNTF